jgi:hypothetical protein
MRAARGFRRAQRGHGGDHLRVGRQPERAVPLPRSTDVAAAVSAGHCAARAARASPIERAGPRRGIGWSPAGGQVEIGLADAC